LCLHEELGEIPSSYLAKTRMEHAARILVQSPDVAISEVAHQVGMRSVSSFAQRFKGYFGCPSRQWRQRTADFA